MNRLSRIPLILALGPVLLAGCNVTLEPGGDGTAAVGGTEGLGSEDVFEADGDALAGFSMVDVNPDSARFQEKVSPRDYLGQVSAWYFGHST